jgi:hypothetical protein
MRVQQDVPARSLFREVNDRVAELGRGSDISHADTDTVLNLICECGSSSCARRIELTVAEYEEVRTDVALSLLSPVHLAECDGQVVSGDDGHLVVRLGLD